MSSERSRSEADFMVPTPSPPIQIFHVEEVVFDHQTDVLYEAAGHQHAGPADGVDLSEQFVRGRTARWRIPANRDPSTGLSRPMEAVVHDPGGSIIEYQRSTDHSKPLGGFS